MAWHSNTAQASSITYLDSVLRQQPLLDVFRTSRSQSRRVGQPH